MNMQHKFQQFLFTNPGVLQFINRRVDIPAVCRSWYAQCTLCSRQCSGLVVLRLLLCNDRCAGGARRKLWIPAVAVSLGCAMLGSTVDTCSASSRVAFGRISTIFHVTGWTRILGSILVVHCTHGDEEVVALVVDSGSALRLLVLLVMHFALCSDVAGHFFLLLSSCTWKFVHYFYEPPVFSAFFTVEILR